MVAVTLATIQIACQQPMNTINYPLLNIKCIVRLAIPKIPTARQIVALIPTLLPKHGRSVAKIPNRVYTDLTEQN
jgi:hypothetical protein